MFDLFMLLTPFTYLTALEPSTPFRYPVVVKLLNFNQYSQRHRAGRINQETYIYNSIIQYMSIPDNYKGSQGFTVSRHTFTFYVTVTFTELKIYQII